MLLTSVNKGLVNGHFPNISWLITAWTTEGSCSVFTRRKWTVAVVSTAGTLVNIYKTQNAKLCNQNGFLCRGKTEARRKTSHYFHLSFTLKISNKTMLTSTGVSIAWISCFTGAYVQSHSITAHRIDVTAVRIGRALVDIWEEEWENLLIAGFAANSLSILGHLFSFSPWY